MVDIIIDDSVLRKKIARTITNSIYGAHPNVPRSDGRYCYDNNYIGSNKEDSMKMGTNYNDMYKHEVRVRVNGNCYYPTECFRYARTDGDEYRVHVKVMPELIAPDDSLHIKNVIFNAPATIVYWEDGSKTVVKCQEGDEFDPEKGITMAFFKRMHGNKGHYFEEIKKWTSTYESKVPEPSNGIAINFDFDNWADAASALAKLMDGKVVKDDDECQSN